MSKEFAITQEELAKTQEENNKIYIQMSKTSIDNFINKNEYKKAFMLLITVLERLNNIEKVEFIDYYSKRLDNLYRFDFKKEHIM